MDLQILTYPGLKPLNWKNPPKRDTRVASNLIAGDDVRFTGSMFVVCEMQWLMTKAPKALGFQIHIMQPPYNSGPLSAGTHDFDYLTDIRPDRGFASVEEGFKFQNWLRRKGHWNWFRHTGSWAAKSAWHCHGAPLPPDGHNFPTKVGVYVDGGLSQFGKITTTSQLRDAWAHSIGLKGQHANNLDNNPLSKYPRDMSKTIFDFDAYIALKKAEQAA